MCDEGASFLPDMQKGREMPEGYGIEGYAYTNEKGRRDRQYCWFKLDNSAYGPDVRSKLEARRGAIKHKAQNP